MKRRYLYSLLFGVPGCLIAAILFVIVLFALNNTLATLVFIYHEQMPPSAMGVFLIPIIIFLLFWFLLVIMGYGIGKTLEDRPCLNGGHILISGGLTLLLFIFGLSWSMKNSRYNSDTELCKKFCFQNAYTASILSPIAETEWTCYCSNHSSGKSITVPIDKIDPHSLK